MSHSNSAPAVAVNDGKSTAPGLVSKHLEAELRDELRGKGMQVWLDKKDEFSEFVDGLRARWVGGDFPFPVCAYRGSFLELMLQLDGRFEGTENRPVLIHMPGFNYDEIRSTPVFEHYEAGKVYRKALSTLVTDAAAGKVAPEEISEFVDGDDYGLADADRWLDEQLSQSQGILEHLELPTLWERLYRDPEKLEGVGDVETHLRARLGISADWVETIDFETSTPAGLADWMTTWALAVEYVDDLRREPFMEVLQPLGDLPSTLIEECSRFAAYLRDNQKEYYARIAAEFEGFIGEEVEEGRAEDLGEIDTFRFEERRSLEGALVALGEERWDVAASIAAKRTPETSFWIRKEPRRGDAWELVGVAAELGAAVDAAGDSFAGMMSLEEAAARYAEEAWQVDRAHRVMAQREATLLVPSLPEFSTLLERLDHVRGKYRKWADRLAMRFTALCEEHGFVATESLQQRRVFDQVVEPLVNDKGSRQGQKVALFLVDALRFEMAAGLAEHFDDVNATRAHLKPRLAELPTVTAVGMNVLAPVHQSGRVEPVIHGDGFRGFQTDQYQVTDPESRKRMMQHHVGGKTCPLLDIDEVIGGEKNLRHVIQQASLVIVQSRDIDEAGEHGFGPLLFERMMRDVRSAMSLLRQAGIRRFVVTSDHGFLMLDKTTNTIGLGKKTDPSSRWRLYDHAQSDENLTSVPLSALNYHGASRHLVLSRDTSVFDTGGKLSNFVHGGNSPQERIIPVLTVEHDRKVGGSTTHYQITAVATGDEKEVQGVTLSVEQTQAALDFGGRDEVELAIRVVDDPDATLDLHSIEGPGHMESVSVVVPVGEAVNVYFHLRADRDRRAQVEIYSPALGEQVEPCRPSKWFEVHGVGKTTKDEDEAAQVLPDLEEDTSNKGLEALPEGPRAVFEYLAKYDAITEADAAQLLGSARALRRFARNLEDHAEKVAFDVVVEQTGSGKRYVRK